MNDMMQIQGEWMNKNTGQKIRVRNSIIDGDQMIIITNMGQISMEEFSRNYIQASDEVYDDEGNVIATEKMTSQPSEQSNIKIETINDQEYFIDDKPVSFNNLIYRKKYYFVDFKLCVIECSEFFEAIKTALPSTSRSALFDLIDILESYVKYYEASDSDISNKTLDI